ncbi:type I-F CRISPR-associated protein Csy1 [Rappaport israeli]|uniref:type I-F CRISPR-associated protein Csy1 n=1 Tax=Rappaport israeli TaxID=1839807 RepID=UPI0009319586|nr:type I-F CRISPR-associated protein Csy1 [Rappaport israeli]
MSKQSKIEQISSEQIKDAIQAFLTAQYDKKTKTEQKQLEKAIEDNDVATIAKINETLQPIKDKYQKDVWLSDAADRMANQLSFGTHISKGIHSSSKGDNLIFDVKNNHNFAGHHSLAKPAIDASGNAAALPLSAFLNFVVVNDITIGQLILKQHPALTAVLHSNPQEAKRLKDIFYQVALSQIINPKTDERNKQILWAIEDDYICLVPLYPVSLTNHFYNQVQKMRFSDENNTTARKNRNKDNEIQKSYPTIHNLAVVNIGGSNPQGVSQLMSKQGGCNYLLPSMPPAFRQSKDIRLSRSAKSFFDAKALQYQAKDALHALFNLIKTNYNNVNIRNARKAILSDIAYHVLSLGETLQAIRPAGWSKDYHHLPMHQKYWLDPKRASLDGEEDFKNARASDNWQRAIEIDFAHWLQGILKSEFKAVAHDFADPEHNEWRREMDNEIKKALRLGKGEWV